MQEQLTTVQKLINTLIEYGVKYGFQALGAIIVLIVGNIVSNWIASMALAAMTKKNMDITLAKFLATVTKITAMSFAIIIALGNFGITIAPFVAAISAMAFGTSFAIQGPLSNYGAGLSIILSRPFVVGDTITVTGISGVVKEVKLACTILTGSAGQIITIPNKDIVGKVIENSSKHKLVVGQIGISYDSKPEDAVRIIYSVLASNADIVRDKTYAGIQSFGDFAIVINYSYFVPTAKAGVVIHTVNLAIFNSLKSGGIAIPFPQHDVRILANSFDIQGQVSSKS